MKKAMLLAVYSLYETGSPEVPILLSARSPVQQTVR
jgi:hypothetical protein